MASLTPEQVEILAEKKLTGAITPEEEQMLNQWASQASPADMEWLSDDQNESALKDRLLMKIRQSAGMGSRMAPVHRIHFLRRFRWAAAAAIILVCTATWWILAERRPEEKITARLSTDLKAPQINKAILTTGDGKQVILENVSNGALAQVAGAFKTNDGAVRFEQTSGAVVMRMVSNPKFSKAISVELPDGTFAWLNAASSISFPSAFTGAERRVALSGEAYFEVKHDATKPFRVKAGEQLIEDIGTSFNVNAYPDEKSVRTTLIEGVVKISEKTLTQILKPGEAFSNGKVEEADTDQAIAWKNGLFSFGNAVDLGTALRQISRWYDVQVVYEGKVPSREFGGKIQRELPISQVIKILNEQKLNCRLENGKLYVSE